jgi:Flp pilus assembly protein TadD
VLDRLEGEALDVSAFGYREAQLRFHEGYVLTQLHEAEPARAAQGQALVLYAESEHLDRTLVHLDRADCLAQGGDIDEAFAHAGRILLGLPQDHRDGLIVSRARALLNGLSPVERDVPAVREFREVLVLSSDT